MASNAARIVSGYVFEVVPVPDGATLDDMFHPDAGFVECDNTVKVGMSYSSGSFGPVPTPFPILEWSIDPDQPVLTKKEK